MKSRLTIVIPVLCLVVSSTGCPNEVEKPMEIKNSTDAGPSPGPIVAFASNPGGEQNEKSDLSKAKRGATIDQLDPRTSRIIDAGNSEIAPTPPDAWTVNVVAVDTTGHMVATTLTAVPVEKEGDNQFWVTGGVNGLTVLDSPPQPCSPNRPCP